MIFKIYRQGQGHWPRGLAVATLALIALFGVAELYRGLIRFNALSGSLLPEMRIPFVEVDLAVTPAFLISLGCFAACAVGTWLLMNHARTVDFLIETGEEMQKVAWPWDASAQGSYWGILPNKGRELFNNSSVVIVGVFMLAGMLFLFDMILQVSLLRLWR